MAKEQSYNKYFAAYSLTSLAYGLCYTGIGPLIPYLAESTNRQETNYSYFFLFRAGGMIIGIILFNLNQSRKVLNYHQLLAISSFAILLVSLGFTLTTNIILQEIAILFHGISFGFIEATLNLSNLKLTNQKNTQFIFMILGGVFGIGGLLAPFIVYLIKGDTYIIFGLATAIIAIPYLFLTSPQNIQRQQKEKSKASSTLLPSMAVTMLSLLMFLYNGSLNSVGGWISSYAVMQRVNTKETAVRYTSFFWGAVCLGRLLMLFVRGKSSFKLKICLNICLTVLIISVGMNIMTYTEQSLIFQSIVLGLAICPVYPMLFAIPKQFGYQLTEKQISFIVAIGPVGEGLVPMMCGLTMQWLTLDMFFYFVIGLLVIMIGARYRLMTIIQKQKALQLNQQGQGQSGTDNIEPSPQIASDNSQVK